MSQSILRRRSHCGALFMRDRTLAGTPCTHTVPASSFTGGNIVSTRADCPGIVNRITVYPITPDT